MTGCPGIDQVDITVFSRHNLKHDMFEWHLDGTVTGIDSPFMVSCDASFPMSVLTVLLKES